MASGDARPVPIKNQPFRLTFPINKNDGSLISGAAGLSAKVSVDGATFATTVVDAVPTPGEIATASGVYTLDLTANHMNGNTVAVLVTSSSTGAVPVVIVMYPQSAAAQIPVDAQAIAGSTAAAANQSAVAATAIGFTVDTATFTATATDFETSLTTSVAADFYKGRSVIFTSGALQNQSCRITASTYTANNKVKLTVTALTAAPANAVSARIV